MSTVPPTVPVPPKKTVEAIHQIGKGGRHRLVINGKAGEVADHDKLARCGDYAATCSLHSEELPQVFKCVPITEITVQTEVHFEPEQTPAE